MISMVDDIDNRLNRFIDYCCCDLLHLHLDVRYVTVCIFLFQGLIESNSYPFKNNRWSTLEYQNAKNMIRKKCIKNIQNVQHLETSESMELDQSRHEIIT